MPFSMSAFTYMTHRSFMSLPSNALNLNGNLDLGLHLHLTSLTNLTLYSDAEWAGCPDTHKSTSGNMVFLGDNLIS
jgi:hypothetical protein